LKKVMKKSKLEDVSYWELGKFLFSRWCVAIFSGIETQAHTCMHAHTNKHKQTHTHTHKQIHTYTQTHTF